MPFEEVIGLQLKRIWADAKDVFALAEAVDCAADRLAYWLEAAK